VGPIETNLTIPAGMAGENRRFAEGLARLRPYHQWPSGSRLRQIFVVSGKCEAGSRLGGTCLSVVWGARGDGVVSPGSGKGNIMAINATCAAAPIVYWPRGVYPVEMVNLTDSKINPSRWNFFNKNCNFRENIV
jgi:hypothetical protein